MSAKFKSILWDLLGTQKVEFLRKHLTSADNPRVGWGLRNCYVHYIMVTGPLLLMLYNAVCQYAELQSA